MKKIKIKAIRLDGSQVTFTPPDLSVHNLMMDWVKLHKEQSKIEEQSKSEKEEWYSIPGLPKYKFKNLKLKNEIIDYSYDVGCHEFNFQFDEILNTDKEND